MPVAASNSIDVVMVNVSVRKGLIGLCAGMLFAAPVGWPPFASSTAYRTVAATPSAPADSADSRLRLGFVDRGGNHLAQVQVMVRDAGGRQVATAASAGPWLDFALAAGVYDITAVFEGETQRLRGVRLIGDRTTTRVIYWDLELVPTEMLASRKTAPVAGAEPAAGCAESINPI